MKVDPKTPAAADDSYAIGRVHTIPYWLKPETGADVVLAVWEFLNELRQYLFSIAACSVQLNLLCNETGLAINN